MFQALDRRRFLPAEPEQGRHAGLRGRCSTGVGWWGVGVWIVLALGTGGCAKARAETVSPELFLALSRALAKALSPGSAHATE